MINVKCHQDTVDAIIPGSIRIIQVSHDWKDADGWLLEG